MRFAALGRTQLLYNSILVCLDRGHELVLVGTCRAAPEYSKTEADFEQLARQYECPFFCDSKINRSKYIKFMKETGSEVAISVNWLTLIDQEVLGQFKHGVINAHAGDLPRYRGNACPNWAILAGESEIVISLHKMVPELDAGPILSKKAFALTPEKYIGDFYKFAEEQIPLMFAEVLDGLENGTINEREQSKDPKLSLRCFPRLSQDGYMDWKLPADDLSRLVRASSEPFAGAFTFLGEEKLIVWRAHASELAYPYFGVPGQVVEVRKHSGEVAVLAGEGVLALEEVGAISSGRELAADKIRSTGVRLGIDWSKLMEEMSRPR